MHHSRLVGGLISLAALLTLLLVSSALVAASSPGRRATPTPALPAATTPRGVAGTGAWAATVAGSHRPALTRTQKLRRRQQRRRHQVVRIARSLRGVPYVYGGASPSGFDCSGLTMYVYHRVGISLSHGATDQAHRGRPVSLRHLKAGDLVFYGSSGYYYHVAVYAGRGRVIDAPHTGAVVRYAELQGAATARRLIG
jgi:peptidoglycan DL-endopeptidase CwlO